MTALTPSQQQVYDALQRAWEERAMTIVPLSGDSDDGSPERLQADTPLTCRVPRWTPTPGRPSWN